MKKIIVLVAATFLLANILAGVGLLVYGFATGRLGQEQRTQYLATWRGEKLVPPPEEVEVREEQETPQQASMRIASAEVEREILSREMHRYEELLRNRQDTIDTAKAKLEKDLKQLEKDKQVFTAKVDQQEALAKDEGFQKALKSYILMKPKYAKQDFMEMEETEVVRYLAAMKADTATKILNQFKTPQEQEKRRQLLKLLEDHKVISLNESSKG
jgi:flagellar motility protein MotE (MotC chaperone)